MSVSDEWVAPVGVWLDPASVSSTFTLPMTEAEAITVLLGPEHCPVPSDPWEYHPKTKALRGALAKAQGKIVIMKKETKEQFRLLEDELVNRSGLEITAPPETPAPQLQIDKKPLDRAKLSSHSSHCAVPAVRSRRNGGTVR
jgi:hypothetical protein